jgi:hypothetical protein
VYWDPCAGSQADHLGNRNQLMRFQVCKLPCCPPVPLPNHPAPAAHCPIHAPPAAAHEAEHEPRVAREVRGVPAPAEVHPRVLRVVRVTRKPGPRLVPRRLLACASSDQKTWVFFRTQRATCSSESPAPTLIAVANRRVVGIGYQKKGSYSCLPLFRWRCTCIG